MSSEDLTLADSFVCLVIFEKFNSMRVIELESAINIIYNRNQDMIKDPDKLLSAYNISQIDYNSKKKSLQSNFDRISDAKSTLQLIKKTFDEIKLGLHNFNNHLNTEEFKELLNLANESKKAVNKN